jgi:hypothetical protein
MSGPEIERVDSGSDSSEEACEVNFVLKKGKGKGITGRILGDETNKGSDCGPLM